MPILAIDCLSIDVDIVTINTECRSSYGSIDLSVENSDSYTYLWSNGGTTQSISELEAGIYCVTISSKSNPTCDKVICQEVDEILAPKVKAVIENATCHSMGAVTISMISEGSIGAREISWDGPGLNNSEPIEFEEGFKIDGHAGDYYIEISDNSGCRNYLFATILQEQTLEGFVNSVELPDCNNNNGTIEVNVTGGEPPFSFYLGDLLVSTQDESFLNFSELVSGYYEITVNDNRNCSTEFHYNLSSNTASNSNFDNWSFTSPICATSLGLVEFLGTGNEDVIYNIYKIGQDSPIKTVFSNEDLNLEIEPGRYFVQALDQVSGCENFSSDFIVNGPPPLTFTINYFEPTCAGGMTDGIIELVDISESYLIDDLNIQISGEGVSFENVNSTGKSLGAGVYEVNVCYDSFGGMELCCLTKEIVLMDRVCIECPAFQAEIAILEPHCHSNNGMASVLAQGDPDLYTYNWSHGETGKFVDNLSAGHYVVTVSSSFSPDCPLIKAFTVSELGAPIIYPEVVHSECKLGGSIKLPISGRTSSYIVNWTGPLGSFSDTTGNGDYLIEGLVAGTYTIEVIDAIGCMEINVVEIEIEESLELIPVDMTMPECGEETGKVSIEVVNGESDYTFSYDGNAFVPQTSNSMDFENLPVGIHNFRVEDKNGCFGDTLVTIHNYETFEGTFPDISYMHAECGTSLGRISFLGRAPAENFYELFYFGSDVPVGSVYGDQSISWDAIPGQYYMVCTDTDGCKITAAYMNVRYPKILDFWVQYECATCNNDRQDGIINVVDITGYPISEVDIVIGGDIPDINISPETSISGLAPGHYTVDVTYYARNGTACTKTVELDLCASVCPEVCHDITAEIAVVDAQCGLSNGNAIVQVLNEGSEYTYIWNTGDTTADMYNLSAGNYTVTITSALDLSCSLVKEISIGEINGPIIEHSIIHPTCKQFGLIELSWEGKGKNYEIYWDGPNGRGREELSQSNFEILGPEGEYAIEIIDNYGCRDFLITQLENQETLEIEVLENRPSLCVSSTGILKVQAINGRAPYTYSLNGFEPINGPDASFTNLSPATYTISVIDADGCQGTITEIILTEYPPLLNLDSWSTAQANCSGGKGLITYDGSGNPLDSFELYALGSKVAIDVFSATEIKSFSLSQGEYYYLFDPIDGCLGVSDLIEIEGASPLDYFVQYQDPTCVGQYQNGRIEIVQITGGYNLDDLEIRIVNEFGDIVSTEHIVDGLPIGKYFISVAYSGLLGSPCTKHRQVELKEASCIDLALKKETLSSGPYRYGDVVDFEITIYNQAMESARDISVVDYLPEGLVFESANNPDWAYDFENMQAETIVEGPLLPGDSIKVFIALIIEPSNSPTAYYNIAEISSMRDINDRNVDDVDSTPDKISNNDGVAINDEIIDPDDEDDHDYEIVDIFDLALIKEIETLGPYSENDVVEFKITVVNQGNLQASNIEIIDYMPTGFSFNQSLNTEWQKLNEKNCKFGYSQSLLPGESITCSLYLNVEYVEQIPENYTNISEIINATDKDGHEVMDADSTPDQVPDNDGNVVDNALTDKGDEDDHDIEILNILGFIPSCVADCDLKCIGQINLSLNEDCEAILTPAMVLSETDPLCTTETYFELKLKNELGELVTNNIVGPEHVGLNLTYSIRNKSCSNECWGKVLVEYKFIPQIECAEEMDLSCGALDMLPLPSIDDVTGCVPQTYTVELINEVREKLDCHNDYTHIVTRTYGVKNSAGTVVSTCVRVFNLLRLELGAIEFPGITKVNCSDLANFIPGANGMPLPWITSGLTGSGTAGVPVICSSVIPTYTGLICPSTGSGTGIPLIPQRGAVELTSAGLEVIYGEVIGDCSAAIRYSDSDVIEIGCTRKITRSWEIYEWWCSSEYPSKGFQVIELFDDMAPAIECPAAFVVTTNDDCAGSVMLLPAIVSDGCGNGEEVRIEHPLGIVENNGGTAELNVGVNVLTYRVSDTCKNTAFCTTTVTVRDETSPVAICEQNTVLSISGDGNTIASSHVFDDGSWDECGEVTSCAVKMEDVMYFLSLDTDIELGGVKYVRKELMNRGCEQEYVGGIEVGGIEYVSESDLCIPYLKFCCSEVDINHQVIYRAIDEGGNYNDCMVNVAIQDLTIAKLSCPLGEIIDCHETYNIDDLGMQFGDPDIEDNCSATQTVKETPILEINDCGIGKLTRLFELIVDGKVVKSCEQEIEIINATPFAEGNIDWPLDYETSCATPPTVLPSYSIDDEACSLLGHGYEDEHLVDPLTGKCTLRRHWTVIDWCTQVEGEFVTYPLNGVPYVQTITIVNEVSPSILNLGDELFLSTNEDCTRGDITIELLGVDDCTLPEELEWSYRMTGSGGFVEEGLGSELSGNYEVGVYSVEWLLADECNNTTTGTHQVEIVGTTVPVAVCGSGMSYIIDASTETAEVLLSDINGGSFHPCGNAMTASLYTNGSQGALYFDCANIGLELVTLYAIDDQTGMYSTCIIEVEIVDDLGVCGEELVVISGEVFTENLEEVEDVKVEIGIDMPFEMTDDLGLYAFGSMQEGGSYEVKPKKTDNPLNGVSTLDLIKIQQHILGIESLDSPYKMLAADVTGNREINGFDLVELRKLILGVYMDFPENSSWRFVEAEYKFADETQPWLGAISESYAIENLSTDMDIDFIGVKIGDVNGDAVTSSLNAKTTDRSSRWPLILEVEEFMIGEGEIVEVPIYGRNYEGVNGWQTTLDLNPDEVEILGLESKGIKLGSANVYLDRQEEGWVTLSYHTSEQETKGKEEALFLITVKVKKRLRTTDLFTLGSTVTANEAYRSEAKGSKAVAVDLVLSSRSSGGEAEIRSVNPNPWISTTTISYYVPRAGEGRLDFYSSNGQLLYSEIREYEEGSYEMLITKEELGVKGVVYVRLTTVSGEAEYKMLVLD